MNSSTAIPDTFLPPEAPPNATSQQIDFTKTSPPLPVYRHDFAAIIDNILTPEECRTLLHLAETSTSSNWERAMVNIGDGKQALAVDSRNCGRIIYGRPELASRLLARLRPFLEKHDLIQIENKPLVTGLRGRGKRYELSRLNEQFRFLKYEGGEYFKPHCDGKYTTPDKSEMSFYTIHLYLNGDGEQDVEELERELERMERDGVVNRDIDGPLLGGATSFMEMPGYNKPDVQTRVFPKTGSVLVFQQNSLLHSGDSVVRGVKYSVRTDVMYRLVESIVPDSVRN